MGRQLWQHQKDAVNFVFNREAAILSLDMGTGKTAVAVQTCISRGHKLVLVVMPKNVLFSGVWSKEIDLAFSAMNKPYWAYPLDKGTTTVKTQRMIDTIRQAKNLPFPLFVLVNYDTIWRSPLKETILRFKWDCIILDEAHRIKAAGSKVSKFFAQVQRHGIAKQRLALTGTPMPNSPLDVYGLCRFIDPSLFGTNFAQFQDRYAVMGGFNRYQVLRFRNLNDLYERFDMVSYRVTAADVLDLPDSVHITRSTELESKAQGYYNGLANDFMLEINQKEIVADNILVKLLRLQQLTGGFVKWDNGNYEQISKAKIELLGEILDELPTVTDDEGIVSKEPVVVFCRFHQEIDAIKSLASDKGYLVSEESGRRKELANWQNGAPGMLVAQIQSGSEGVDLTRARYTIYFSKVYSLGVYQQSLRRTLRPGQTRTTFFIHLTVAGTVDDDIEKCLDKKTDIINYLLDRYRYDREKLKNGG